MSKNKLVFVPALAMSVLLAACGGGGGGGGGTPAADLSTPGGVVQALAPALTVASSGVGGASWASARTDGATLKRWTPTSPSAKRGVVMPKAAEPCPTDGSVEYYEFDNKDVSSPFTTSNFSGNGYIWRDCLSEEAGEGATYTQYNDGRREGGEANDDGTIYYDRDTDFVDRFTLTTPEYEYRTRFETDGTVHGDYDPEAGSTDERIDMNLSAIYVYEEGNVEERIEFTAFIGTADEDFQIVSSTTTLLLDGVFGMDSSDYPDCTLGRARISMDEPLVRDGETGELTGALLLEAGGDEADVLLRADGGADITIDGQTTSLTAEQIDALVDECPSLDVDD